MEANSSLKKRIRNDIILVLAIGLAALILWGVVSLAKKQGAYAVVSVNGEDVARYPLDTDIEITVDGYDGGKNTIVIQSGKVCVSCADCPDRLCVKQRTIKYVGETITCLPHRMVVRIEGELNNGVDVVP